MDPKILDRLNHLSKERRLEIVEILSEHYKRSRYNKAKQFYTDSGPAARALYPKHMEFFKMGKDYFERIAVGGNRTGKSYLIKMEDYFHATGLYPDWWQGHRIYKPCRILLGTPTPDTLRNVIQRIMLGSLREPGTGLIPKDLIVDITKRPGGGDVFQEIYVKHVTGGVSSIIAKTYKQDRDSFSGDELDFADIDEECPADIYSEIATRLLTTGGRLAMGFTPLDGLTEVVLKFLPGGRFPATLNRCGPVEGTSFKWVTNLTWDDAPHLLEHEKAALYETFLPHERAARMKGIPSIGSGMIWPVDEDSFLVDPFRIPPNWPRAKALDCAFGATAVLWGAVDPNTDTVYIYGEYEVAGREPYQHVHCIDQKGKWIPGAGDPSALRNTNPETGKKLIQIYRELGMDFVMADNSVEPGIKAVYIALTTGKLKVMRNCMTLRDEMRIYRYDKNGKVAENQKDHLCDCLRYFLMTAKNIAITEPDPFDDDDFNFNKELMRGSKDKYTGY